MQGLKHILYFADGEFGPTRAFRRALALAQQHGAQLTLMDVTIESGFSADLVRQFGLGDDVQQSEQRYAALSELTEDWVGPRPPRLRVTIGTPFIEVIRAVLRDQHDLVLIPARARPGRNLFASTDMHLLRKCPCTVWIEREPSQPEHEASPPRCRRVLASVDPMQRAAAGLNHRILEHAITVAQQDEAVVDVAHAVAPRFGEPRSRQGDQASSTGICDAAAHLQRQHAEALHALVADHREHLGDGHLHLLQGEPALEVLSAAERLGSDLIVLATLSAPREPGLFIGSTAEDLLQTAKTSVLALKPDGFVTPVQ
jgi:nucleotide-binding universal stress UspA family protein